MFVVVGVTSGRCGGRPLLRWWLWDEEGSRITICDGCDFWINVPMRAHNYAWIMLTPKFEVDAVL